MLDRGFRPRLTAPAIGLLALFSSLAGCSSDGDSPETPAGGAEASVPGDGSDGGAGEAGAVACQDDDGFIPSCSAINGLAERQCDRAVCDRYVKRMKTRVARRAIQCMQRHIAAGDSCRPCSAEALATSCPDAVAQTACDSLVKTCPARNAAECVPLLSGLSFGGRLNFVTCATNESCLHDLPSCLP